MRYNQRIGEIKHDPTASEILQKYWLTWEDIANLEYCGRSKALKMLHALPHSYHGRKPMVRTVDYLAYYEDHDEITVDWS